MKYLTRIFNFCRSVNTHCTSELYLPEIKWPELENSILTPIVFLMFVTGWQPKRKLPLVRKIIWENSEKIALYAGNWLWKKNKYKTPTVNIDLLTPVL